MCVCVCVCVRARVCVYKPSDNNILLANDKHFKIPYILYKHRSNEKKTIKNIYSKCFIALNRFDV